MNLRTQTADPGGERKMLLPMTLRRLMIVAGPACWAVLILFHPNPGDGSPYEAIKGTVDRWLLVHIGQLVLTPFLFFAVWRLLDGLSSAAATASRAALVVWTVFFSVYDSIQGITTGILIRHANGLAGEERDGIASAVDFLVEDSHLAGNVSVVWVVATASWLIVAIAAAVALHRAGAGRAVVAATALSAVFAVHVAPAAVGLVALLLAGVIRERQRGEPAHGAPAVA